MLLAEQSQSKAASGFCVPTLNPARLTRHAERRAATIAAKSGAAAIKERV